MPEDVPPVPPPPGDAAGRKKLLAIVIVAVLVIAALSIAAYVLLAVPPSVEATLDMAEVSASKTTIDQREQLAVTARAIDTAGTDRSSVATYSWRASPGTSVQFDSTNVASVNVIAIQSGSVSLTANVSWKGVSREASLSLTISALQFEIAANTTTPDVGTPVTLTVRAIRGGPTATSYTGTVNFTSDDPTATLPGNTPFASGDAGQKDFTNVIVRKSGAVRITVRDTIAAITGTITLMGQRPANAPIASFAVARNLMHVDVDASASTDPDNNIATYAWSWGDGQTTPASASPTASHDYATPGLFTIVLTVTDDTAVQDITTRKVSVAQSTLDFEYWDFFNVPFKEYWDYRFASYGDLPVNAECFNQTSIANLVCVPSRPAVPDVASYPYTNWYPLPGNIQPGNPNNNPLIYAPFRFSVDGRNVAGYNLSEPVFLPILKYSEPRGNRLDFDWRMDYVDTARADDIDSLCGTGIGFSNDGFIIESTITLTMDLQQSKRMFGVVGADAAAATAWWAANTKPACTPPKFNVENQTEAWFVAMGGGATTTGKYDIFNAFEYFYAPFLTNVAATVDTDGTTHVTISHVAWGGEVLMSRWFYWGNVSYAANYLDSTKRAGWWGMELGWFEDFAFTGSLRANTMDFNLTSVMQYQFQQLAFPGPDGFFNRVGDVPFWTWGPILVDYFDQSDSPATPHHRSELDRYPTQTYRHTTPGSAQYNKSLAYDYVPITWDLRAGETQHFQFPVGNVVFYDPNTTPIGANPTLGQYVVMNAPLELANTVPANFGDWDAAAKTWDILGPAVTGGPNGSPGNYPLESFPAIYLIPGATAFVQASAVANAVGGADAGPIDGLGAPVGGLSWSSWDGPEAREARAAPARSDA